MGLLDQENMLRILIIGLGLLFMISPWVRAEKIKFFEDKIDFFSKKEEAKKDNPETQGCAECGKKNTQNVKNISSETQTKIGEIQQKTQERITKIEQRGIKRIILFIEASCKYSGNAVNTLVRFKENNQNWQVEGVIEVGPENMKDTLLKKAEFFQDGIDFSVDIAAKKAAEFGIDKTPAYIIVLDEKLYKIAGQPDLMETISKIIR